MILAINTSTQQHELALLEEQLVENQINNSKQGVDSKSSFISNFKILSEKIWNNERKDLDEIIPKLQAMLDENGLIKKDLSKIIIVRGPGPFTSVRTGVVFANTLADALHLPLYSITTFEYLRRRVAGTEPLITLIKAGRIDVAMKLFPASEDDETPQIGPLSTLLAPLTHSKYQVVAELNETLHAELHSICFEKDWKQIQGHELLSLGEIILTYGLEVFEKCSISPQENDILNGCQQVDPYYLKKPKITLSKNKWKQ
jgi:tRNA threonylcarbamoyl adenosine modification protein YeaZ